MREMRPTVLVDMDGVLADFDGATEEFLRINHPEIAIVKRANFYFRDDYPEEAARAILNNLHASQYFFENLPPMPGAALGWHRLIELGYNPQICTSPLHTNEWCREEKLNWLERNLGKTAAKSALITSDKDACDGIALIDDRPDIKDSDQASWQHVVFDRSYNRHIDTPFRLHGWFDKNLGRILQECAEQYRLAD
ncbi:MAG TPA: hypothetical protein VFL81_00975 [Candidatus Saccharimonadales bacterium]|nr:hypothetical protein [Candidatus Saccharimonadales bacterium]